jgi:hypothetical protein
VEGNKWIRTSRLQVDWKNFSGQIQKSPKNLLKFAALERIS